MSLTARKRPRFPKQRYFTHPRPSPALCPLFPGWGDMHRVPLLSSSPREARATRIYRLLSKLSGDLRPRRNSLFVLQRRARRIFMQRDAGIAIGEDRGGRLSRFRHSCSQTSSCYYYYYYIMIKLYRWRECYYR